MATAALIRADSAIVHTATTKTSNISFAEFEASVPTVHPLKDFISRVVKEYVLENWDFEEDEKSRQRFIASGITGLACDYFPSALDERIGLVARLFAVVYLIADFLSDLDSEDGEEYVSALEAAARGYWMPDEQVPAVFMFCGLFDEMRAIDYISVDDIMETTLSHLRAGLFRRGRSVNRSNSGFRIGAALVSSLESFAMGVGVDGEIFSPL